jgi:hypothetical protein
MRWREYIDRLTQDDSEQLINTLTLACGQVAAAVRITSRNGPVSGIQGLLVRSAGAFAVVGRQLAPFGGTRLDSRVTPPHTAPALALTWQEFLARLGAEGAAIMLDRLEDATHQARLAGTAVLADAPVELVAEYVEQAAQAVEAVNQWLTSAVAALER